MKKVAMVLSGCGVFDGSEIHEAVIALLNLQMLGAQVCFFAPQGVAFDAVNHVDGAPEGKRDVLIESARIARGNISPLSAFDPQSFDAIVFVGGFGAAKNLCSFAFDGPECTVNKDVEVAIKGAIAAGKKLAFMCISPVIAARVISSGVKLTIGSDAKTAAAIEAMGAKHVDCPADSFVEDESFGVFSTPAYMLAKSTVEIDKGVGRMFAKMLSD